MPSSVSFSYTPSQYIKLSITSPWQVKAYFDQKVGIQIYIYIIFFSFLLKYSLFIIYLFIFAGQEAVRAALPDPEPGEQRGPAAGAAPRAAERAARGGRVRENGKRIRLHTGPRGMQDTFFSN